MLIYSGYFQNPGSSQSAITTEFGVKMIRLPKEDRVNDMEESPSPFISATLHLLALLGKQGKDDNTFHRRGMEAWSCA